VGLKGKKIREGQTTPKHRQKDTPKPENNDMESKYEVGGREGVEVSLGKKSDWRVWGKVSERKFAFPRMEKGVQEFS